MISKSFLHEDTFFCFSSVMVAFFVFAGVDHN